MAGRASGTVTLRKTVHRLAPDISADSSSEGSMDRNAATMSRNTIGLKVQPLDPDHAPQGEHVERAAPERSAPMRR